MKLKQSSLNIALIVCFVSMLLIPLLFINTKRDTISKDEKRTLANMPSPSMLFSWEKTRFIKEFESYVNDNIGFREYFMGLNNSFEKTFTKNDIRRNPQYIEIIGKAGHAYYGTDFMINKYQGRYKIPQDRMDKFIVNLNKISAYLKDKNIPFYLMAFTDKETIYPQFYTNAIVKGKGEPLIDEFTKYVGRNAKDVTVFNIRDTLDAHSDEVLLYNKVYDTEHFNEYGAFYAYQNLMEKLKLPAKTLLDFNVEYVEINGDTVPKFTPKYPITADFLNDDLPQDSELFKALKTSYTTSNEKLPNILVMRDSYFGYVDTLMMKFLPESFNNTITLAYNELNRLKKCVDEFLPDYMVLGFAERELQFFMNCVINMEL